MVANLATDNSRPQQTEGEKTSNTGINEVLTVDANVGTNITIATDASAAVASASLLVQSGTSAYIPWTSNPPEVVVVAKDNSIVGGLGVRNSQIGFLVADFDAVRSGLIELQKLNPTLGSAGVTALASVPEEDLALLKSNPAEFAERTNSPDGLLTYGRWQNGYVLGIDATLNGTLTGSTIELLSGFKSEHLVYGDPPTANSQVLAKYNFVGGTRSTSSISNELGSGLTAASILFDFALGYGSLEGTLVHDAVMYSLLGDLVQDGTTFSGLGGVARTSSRDYAADFVGFFSGHNGIAPRALGLSYGVYTPGVIAGVAAFGLIGSGDSQLRLLPQGSVVGLSHYFEQPDGCGFGCLLSSSSYLYNVGGSNTGVLSGNLLDSFRTEEPSDRCSGLTCSFNRNSSVATVDLTGPPAFNPRSDNSQSPTGAHTQLGVNWARFSPGYSATKNTNHVERGSAHIITLKNPTVQSDLPNTGTGTYNVLRGGTKPTVLFATGGVLQPEVVGDLTAASITVDFATGAANASFAGSFADGGNGGTFALAGQDSVAFTNSTFAFMPLSGRLVSAQVSANGASCSPGFCALVGRTDMQIVGSTGQAIGGVFDATTLPRAGGQPVFGVSGTYLLEQSSLQQNNTELPLFQLQQNNTELPLFQLQGQQ